MSRRTRAVQFQRGGNSTVGGFNPTTNDGDPIDPTPKSRGLARLAAPSRAKPARRDGPATKRRASSRRR